VLLQPSNAMLARSDVDQVLTDGNIEQHIRKLEEGFAAIQSWVKLQTNIRERLMVDVDRSAQEIEKCLARVGASQQS
jgi:hypothetical protein